MEESRKNIRRAAPRTTMERIEKMHPHKMLLILGMFGSSLIFFFMLLAYTVSRPVSGAFPDLQFPKAFVVSTFIILISSFYLARVVPNFLQDNFRKVVHSLGAALLLGIGFVVSQYIGWKQLAASGIYLNGKASGAYLYVLSGLHILHLVVGLIFLSVIFIRFLKIHRDPVKCLVTVTNPYQRILLEMLTSFWHFMDILWIILFFYFFFTF